jgi:O-antigen ligase
MVFLPYWLSATITKFSAFTKRIWHFSIENVLLIVGFYVLFETLSRAGLAAFILVVGFFFVRFNFWLIRKISQHLSSKTTKVLITLLLIVGFLLAYLGLAVGVVFLLSKIDPRMTEVFSLSVLQGQGITKYADMLQFGERVTYWQAGWNIFNAHPFLGVGLGNAGFYFPQFLPDKAWSLTEVRQLLYHSAGLMNIKSMWSRILAETGIIGFSCFMILLAFSGITAFQLTHSKTLMQKTIGWMGISMLIAFLIEGFSIDSFALPYLWITLGLVAAVWRWSVSEVKES